MGACASKVPKETPINNIQPPSRSNSFKSTPIIKYHTKTLLILGYIRINFPSIIPTEIEALIASFHPELNTKTITYLIDGYIRRYLKRMNHYDSHHSLRIHHLISLYFSKQKSFIVDVFHRKTNHNINKPKRHIFHLDCNEQMTKLLQQIAEIYNTSTDLVKLYKCPLAEHIRVLRQIEIDKLSILTSNDWPISAYIIKDWEVNQNEVRLYKLYHRVHHHGRSCIWGIPLVISMPMTTRNKEIYHMVNERLSMLLGSVAVPIVHDYEINNGKLQDLPFRLWEYEDTDLPIIVFHLPRPDYCNHRIIPANDEIFGLLTHSLRGCIVIEWERGISNHVKKIVQRVVNTHEYARWKKENMRELE